MITLSEKASTKVKSLLETQGTPNHGLRVFVKGGGCSGLQYGMAIFEKPNEDDEVIDSNGIQVFLDPMSAQYLNGVEIDYEETVMGGGFKIHNPNAVSTCGCGHSFKA